jgi:hypothetical protein
MHSALSVLLTLSLSISSSTAYTIPTLQSPIPAKKAYTPSLGTSCTFTLFHKQLCPGGTPASTKANYIQINTIHDHFNNMTIDIAALRPLAAHSSYVRVSEDRGLAIKNLRDGRHLTVKGSDESDDVAFEYAGVSWSTEEWKVSEGVGCMASAWSVESEQWACGLGSRVSYDSTSINLTVTN